MRKSKLTNKEITSVLGELSQADQILLKEIIEMKNAFTLYLDYRKETYNEEVDGFNNYVKVKAEEFERKQYKDKK